MSFGLRKAKRVNDSTKFVLEPLAAIAPDAIHPLLGKSIGKLLEELLPSSINR